MPFNLSSIHIDKSKRQRGCFLIGISLKGGRSEYILTRPRCRQKWGQRQIVSNIRVKCSPSLIIRLSLLAHRQEQYGEKMNTILVVALVVPWVFWGILMGLLIAAGRSWVNLLLFPACITVLILIVASVSSVRGAFWTSFILHFFLLVFFLGSYLCFMPGERKK